MLPIIGRTKVAMGSVPTCHFRSDTHIEGVFFWYLSRPGEIVRIYVIHVPYYRDSLRLRLKVRPSLFLGHILLL